MKKNEDLNYLVPFDFTEVAISALESAVQLKKNNGGEIYVLNVIKNQTYRTVTENKMTALKKSWRMEKSVYLNVLVTEGDLIEQVIKTAKETKANYVVMGTHGVKGSQNVFGSHALRMVADSDIPFLITQKGKSLTNLKNIVLTYSYDKETVQITKFIEELAKNNEATIHLVGYIENEQNFKSKTLTNEVILGGFLNEKKINYEFAKLPGVESYDKELLDYAQNVDAGVIAAAYFNGSKIALFKNFVQDLITNDKSIPVLTANAETLSKMYF